MNHQNINALTTIGPEDIKNIIDEISTLKNQGVVLSDKLDSEDILSQYELIYQQSKKVIIHSLNITHL